MALEVKSLEWVPNQYDMMIHTAKTPFFPYTVMQIGPGDWRVDRHASEFGKFKTIEAAKAAAEADFSQRILSVLKESSNDQ